MRHKTILIVFSVLFLLSSALIFTQSIISPVNAQSTSSGDVSGFAWGSNMGFIRFNGGNYGVSLLRDPGVQGARFSGDSYAWGSNIGWIRFKPIISASGDNALPTGATDAHVARLEVDNTTVTGWIRACSVFVSDCAGLLRPSAQTGGWDGWIKMNATGDITKDVHLTASNQFQGYAWGATNVGWIDFCGTASGNGNYCVSLNSVPVTCSVNPTLLQFTDSSPLTATWSSSLTDSNYNYNWHWDYGSPDIPSAGPHDISYGANSPQSIRGTISVIDKNDPSKILGEGTCVLTTEDSRQKVLTVSVLGTGAIYGNVADSADSAKINCGFNGGACSHNQYLTDGLVTLTREISTDGWNLSTGRITFGNWVVTPSSARVSGCGSADITCQIKLSEPTGTTVVSYFVNPTPTAVATLTATPLSINIVDHTSGFDARSTRSTIEAINTGTADIQVCLVSVKSKRTGQQKLDDIITNVPGGTNDLPACLFDGNLANSSCNSATNCFDVPAPLDGSSNTVTKSFLINIKDKFRAIKDNSPYDVVIEVRKDGDYLTIPGYPTRVNLEFVYRPSGSFPR